MIEVIYAIKFVHVLAAAAMFGTWLCLAMFMLLAHRSGNPSVVALTSRFVVQTELLIMIGAMVLQPLSGFSLASAIGLSPADEFWIVLSSLLYVLVVAGWLAALRVEFAIRNLAHEAAVNNTLLSDRYAPLFRLYSLAAAPTLTGMAALFALMIWQPRLG